MGEAVSKVFKHPPSAGTWKEVFEQLVAFTLSPEYAEMKALIEAILGKKRETAKPVELAAKGNQSLEGQARPDLFTSDF